MEELSELLLQRRRKVDALWEAGINPYPNDFRPQHTSADIKEAYGDWNISRTKPGYLSLPAGSLPAVRSARPLLSSCRTARGVSSSM